MWHLRRMRHAGPPVRGSSTTATDAPPLHCRRRRRRHHWWGSKFCDEPVEETGVELEFAPLLPCPGVDGGVVLSGHTRGCGLVLFPVPVVVEPVGGACQVEYAVDGDTAQRLVEAHPFGGVPVLGGPVGGHGSPHDHFSGGGDVG